MVVASTTAAALAFASAPARSGTCDWGASSATATFANGHWTISEPATSGCQPQ